MNYLLRQLQVLFATLGELRRTPLSSLNTILVAAIALLLPCYLFIAVKTTEQLTTNWQGRPQLTLFLIEGIDAEEAAVIFEEVNLNPRVARAQLMTPDDALNEFSVLSGAYSESSSTLSEFATELDFLGENPLPFSIVLMPKAEYTQPDAVRELQQLFETIEGIDSIRLDLEWVAKFGALSVTIERIALMLSGLLGLGLVLIIGNTIKLLIINRRHEIEVIKLVGGSNRFVRRPFLYYGALIGFFGGVFALLLLLLSSIALTPALDQLAQSYQASSIIYRFSAVNALSLLAAGTLIGWISARWSVAQHIWRIRPR